jgi:hypothetical protein
VSSAKSIGEEREFTILGRSLIYTRNSKGPRTDPCGTQMFWYYQRLTDTICYHYHALMMKYRLLTGNYANG